jgi:hypothetical protein
MSYLPKGIACLAFFDLKQLNIKVITLCIQIFITFFFKVDCSHVIKLNQILLLSNYIKFAATQTFCFERLYT